MGAALPIPVATPLAVGVVAIACTILIHTVATIATVTFFRREQRRGQVGRNITVNVAIVFLSILFALAAHLVDIALWAALFVALKEFPDFGIAYYHSAVNYTTLGYGDLIMTRLWRLLGPLEAADGMLMFGVTTAMVFAVIQRVLYARLPDLQT